MHPLLLAVYSAFSALLFAIAAGTLWWMLHAWRTPEVLRGTGFQVAQSQPQLSFSLLVPGRHEEAVMGATLDTLMASDHPDFEVIAIVGHDDHATREVAEAAARRHGPRLKVVVDENWPKNKPKALNTALPHCTGDVVGVFDAEDEVDPRLLRQVDATFSESGAHIVQGGVQLMNFRTTWYSLRNCLEYFFWFRSRLHLHAEHRFIPLGGNTVFVRTPVLRAVDGWDAECLAEDCELGVRLSTLGAKVAIAYSADLVTREETPDTLRSLFKQRTRWNQGFLQVLRKGEWRHLPSRRQRLLARYTLSMPFLQAFAGLGLLVSLATALWMKAPVVLALLSFLPAVPTLVSLAFEMAGLREFCRLYYVRPRAWDYARLLAGMFPYQLVLAAAAVRAVVREALGQRGWEKTAHVGAHRAGDTAAVRPQEAYS
ncbi:glycosyltransferase [Acidiferrimicrobium sp. IK]|uniref:glycosyltransferase n=1 Tax=Acidiferrimicrobium sp. IK TaxID=2871700 RepID=UPI0021CAFA50|nr:glycosyltransferase [Acidiferrimicrobium sp. IK]MCU4186285.1 glycosyltransferase [Acidiferrimicrobium sp. IK]